MNSTQAFNRAFCLACESNQPETVKELLRERPDTLYTMTPWGSWLHVAAKTGALEVVRLLLSLGLDPNTRGGTFGGNALNVAAGEGHLNVMVALLEAGAILDTSEPERNPLFGAIYGGHLRAVEWLVEKGVDYCVPYTGKSMTNMDALAFAVERGQSEIASYLLSVRYAA